MFLSLYWQYDSRDMWGQTEGDSIYHWTLAGIKLGIYQYQYPNSNIPTTMGLTNQFHGEKWHDTPDMTFFSKHQVFMYAILSLSQVCVYVRVIYGGQKAYLCWVQWRPELVGEHNHMLLITSKCLCSWGGIRTQRSRERQGQRLANTDHWVEIITLSHTLLNKYNFCFWFKRKISKKNCCNFAIYSTHW